MLNELQELHQALAEHGIQTEAWHPWIKPLAKYATFIVELDVRGCPLAVSSITRERASTLRNIQPDNQKSFPAFNLNSPLFKLPTDVGADSSHLEALAACLEQMPIAYKKKDLDRLQRLLRDFPGKEISPVLAKSGDAVLDSTRVLLTALAGRKDGPEAFLKQFGSVLLGTSLHGGLPVELALDVLFGKLGRSGTREPWQCILFLDLHDLSEVSHRVADPATAIAWSAAMLAPKVSAEEAENVMCALTGVVGPSAGDKMPNPNLPLLGGTYLLSMNADVPCQTRYGQSSTSIYPVSRQAIHAANDALLHMTHPGQKDKTWSSVPNGKGDKPDLLIAYLEQDPYGEISVMPIIGDDDEEWATEEGEGGPEINPASPFEQRTRKLIEALQMRERVQGIRDDHLRFFVLSTIDKGRKQVLFDGRYRVERIYAAQERWLDGAANAPKIDVRLFQGKGKRMLTARRHVPSPGAVVSSFRLQWIRSGKRCQKVGGVSLGRIYTLLLDERPEREAVWLLERYLPLKLELLRAAGLPVQSKKSGTIDTHTGAALSNPARKDALIAVATLGILLRALGHEKENYMKERDFVLGQFLQFADRLHLFYCEGVRGGQVPPQLIGNAHINMAMQSPRRALDVLAERMPIYLAYMKRTGYEGKTKTLSKEARIARWLERCIGELSRSLNELGFEGNATEVGKAELLLGYLAMSPKHEGIEGGTFPQAESTQTANDEQEQA